MGLIVQLYDRIYIAALERILAGEADANPEFDIAFSTGSRSLSVDSYGDSPDDIERLITRPIASVAGDDFFPYSAMRLHITLFEAIRNDINVDYTREQLQQVDTILRAGLGYHTVKLILYRVILTPDNYHPGPTGSISLVAAFREEDAHGGAMQLLKLDAHKLLSDSGYSIPNPSTRVIMSTLGRFIQPPKLNNRALYAKIREINQTLAEVEMSYDITHVGVTRTSSRGYTVPIGHHTLGPYVSLRTDEVNKRWDKEVTIFEI